MQLTPLSVLVWCGLELYSVFHDCKRRASVWHILKRLRFTQRGSDSQIVSYCLIISLNVSILLCVARLDEQ